MTTEDDHKAHLLRALTAGREALLWKLEGLSERDARWPVVPTGTNLLGIVKHVASVEAGYLGDVFGRPSPEHLPWFADDAEVDLRPGGDLTIGERSGFVEEVAEPSRFVFWWAADGEESSRVEIELEPAVAGTRVRVIETRPLQALSTFAAGPQLSAVA